jgi:hypothetical protein
VALRQRQGFNSVSLIAAFPTWASDQYPVTYADKNGVFLRNTWEAFGERLGWMGVLDAHAGEGLGPFYFENQARRYGLGGEDGWPMTSDF